MFVNFYNRGFMKKFLTIILCLTGGYVFPQNMQTNPTQGMQQSAPQQMQQPASQGVSLRLNAYATYAFDDNSVDSYYSNTSYFQGAVKGGFEYGGGLEVMLHKAYGLEFTYLRLDSKAPMEYYNNGVVYTNFDLASNYIMVGGNRYLQMNPKIEPYGGMMLGAAVFNVTDPDIGESSSATKFAWGIKAGLNIWASEKVGIKLQASLLSASQAVGGSVYFGTGGAGAGVSGYSTFYQFILGGGLVIKLNKN
jgi:hypothetical protein